MNFETNIVVGWFASLSLWKMQLERKSEQFLILDQRRRVSHLNERMLMCKCEVKV